MGVHARQETNVLSLVGKWSWQPAFVLLLLTLANNEKLVQYIYVNILNFFFAREVKLVKVNTNCGKLLSKTITFFGSILYTFVCL